MKIQDLPGVLRSRIPETVPLIDDHVTAYTEVLPHVLFGDLTRFVVQAHERGQTDLEERCLRFLEEALLEGDDDVRNVVEVSFIENVGPWDLTIQTWVAGWPPALRAAAQGQLRRPSA